MSVSEGGRVFLWPIFSHVIEGTAEGRDAGHFLHTLLWPDKRVWRDVGTRSHGFDSIPILYISAKNALPVNHSLQR